LYSTAAPNLIPSIFLKSACFPFLLLLLLRYSSYVFILQTFIETFCLSVKINGSFTTLQHHADTNI
jgi:hypothetical protein